MTAEFASLLPSNSTAWERAIERTSGERWLGIDVDIIRRARDPWLCPAHLLPYLAYERSVDVWDESWPEWKMRAVIAAAPEDHRLKGTQDGTRRYVEHADARLVQVVTRPQGIVLAPRPDKASMDAYIARHPKLRITLGQGEGRYIRPSGVFVGASALGRAAFRVDRGPDLARRVAVLSHKGIETRLLTSHVETRSDTRIGVRFERLVIPGRAPRGLACDRSAFGRAALGDVGIRSKVFSFALDQAYDHRESALWLDAVAPGFEPRDSRFIRESEVGDLAGRMAIGRAVGRGAVSENRAARLLADVLYLYDPDAAPLRLRGRSFLGRSRLAMPHHQADMLVDRKTRLRKNSGAVIGLHSLRRIVLRQHSSTRSHAIVAAMAASKRLSDRILVSFNTHRPRTWTDGIPLDGSARLGSPIRNRI